ncbi:MAG: sigma 54-interacting transcriptional regulator [Parahaliea sp.]
MSNERRDATLPSVMAELSSVVPDCALSLTIVFHPCLARIGQHWCLPLTGETIRQPVGRYQPLFDNTDPAALNAGVALNDSHISRRALVLAASPAGVTLSRVSGASRCLVQGEELNGCCELSPQVLQCGVSLQLGHAVVLWLRFGPVCTESSTDQQVGRSALLGGSATMSCLRRQIQRAAATDLDVLILGETGAGKELVANEIHSASERAGQPLVSINMSAIPTSLAPALLFGSARGAYTGATQAQTGYFQQAANGSLFMDEIGDVPAEIQPQLLRALQQREIQVVGGNLESINVRIIAATDCDLDADDCSFDSALRHRLGCLEIHLPSLRDHAEDIGQLLLHFLRSCAQQIGSSLTFPDEYSDPLIIARWADTFRLFSQCKWPGNVRELCNAAQQLLVASDHVLAVPDSLLKRLGPLSISMPVQETRDDLRMSIEVNENMVRQAMADNAYEVSAAAKALGVSRQVVYRRLEELPDFRLVSDIPESEIINALASVGGNVRQAAGELAVSYRALKNRLGSRIR